MTDTFMAVLSSASSKVSITFDFWTDRSTRGILAITGHFYDRPYHLRAPFLSIERIPKHRENHNAQRMYACVSNCLRAHLGARWHLGLHCVVTDGASNVSAASQMLG